MIMPDVLIVENYRTMSFIGILDSIPAIALPYVASAFGIFLLRQTFKSVPRELDEAARVEGAGPLQVLLKVYVPLAKPVYLAYGLVSVSYHWNNFLWPLIVTNSVESRPLTVGLQVFSSGDQGIDWSIICAATLMTSSPSSCSSGNSCRALCAREFADALMKLGAHAGRRREAEIAARDHRLAAAMLGQLLGLAFLGACVDRFGIEQRAQPLLAGGAHLGELRVG